jgi:hypothetical protein
LISSPPSSDPGDFVALWEEMTTRSVHTPALRCWLQRADGSRLQLSSGGLLVGRTLSCHVVLTDSRVSKCHALVRLSSTGPEVVPLGRNPLLVNGASTRRPTLLKDGDTLGFPGEEMSVVLMGAPRGDEPLWLLERPGGYITCLHGEELSLGGGVEDDLYIPGWPPGAARIRAIVGELLLMIAVEGTLNGEALTPMEMPVIATGDRLAFGGESIRFLQQRHGSLETTLAAASPPPPDQLRAVGFRFLPEGGELALDFGAREVSLQLSELRGRLIAVLLSPGGEYAAGEYIPDEVLIAGVWPRQVGKGRGDVNLLVYRVRLDLVKAGVNPHRVLERLKRGQATRFCLPEGCALEIE